MYLSEQLILKLESDAGVKFKLCDKQKMQKTIRAMFIQIHNEAVEETIMASNRLNYIKPNFTDK